MIQIPDPHIPVYMRNLPLDRKGRPVPWFAAWIGGEPDFRLVAPGKMQQALRGNGRCWVCGNEFGRWDERAFVIGPMCAVNRISAEPPSHRDCAEWAVRACPFLTRPHMRRREAGLPAELGEPAGIMIDRNPGIAVTWTTRLPRTFRDPAGGTLFNIGEPESSIGTSVGWWCEGRAATRAEVLDAIDAGLPALIDADDLDLPDRNVCPDHRIGALFASVRGTTISGELATCVASALPFVPSDTVSPGEGTNLTRVGLPG
jgi:hypothetical protein